MNTNTFEAIHLAAIQKYLTQKGKMSEVKRSKTFNHAVVAGTPGFLGCVMVSFSEETNQPGRSGWLVSVFRDHHAREVANGEIDVAVAETATVFYWRDMLEVITANVC